MNRPSKSDAVQIGIPARPFLFTLDQISVMTGITESDLLRNHCFFQDRSIGRPRPDQLKVRDMNQLKPGTKPDWRVLDIEFVRWMKSKGFRYYEVGRFSS